MRKLINAPLQIVREMLEGTVLLSPGLALLADENVILRADLPAHPDARPVALISGGGSGHEPAHAGYVGHGMLSAAVVGDVFTSPSVDAVLAAIHAVAGPAGAVLVVKNYTGDRLNFGLAAELARVAGIPTEIVVVADDVSLRDTVERGRRRGIAGTVLVHKLAGAAIAAGKPLAEVAAIARAAAGAVGTVGVGLGACTVPAAGKPSFELAEGEMELGLGIHGEKGVQRVALEPADQVVERILGMLLEELQLAEGSRVALLVNGLGSTPAMELAIVARATLGGLARRGIVVERAWAGNFMTALEMPGCSLSLLPLAAGHAALLDAPTTASAWTGIGRVAHGLNTQASNFPQAAARGALTAAGPISADMQRVLRSVAQALEAAESALTELDSRAGDGDLGASMQRGAAAALQLPASSYATPEILLTDLADSLRRAIAGSSGPFYAAGLARAAASLAGKAVPAQAEWRAAFSEAIAAISEIGGARPGDRTMLDALAPALAAWSVELPALQGFEQAVAAAEAGAAHTATLRPRLGRASYLGERALGVPDGGAVAVATWLRAIATALKE